PVARYDPDTQHPGRHPRCSRTRLLRVSHMAPTVADGDTVEMTCRLPATDLLHGRFGTGTEPHRDAVRVGANISHGHEHVSRQAGAVLPEPLDQLLGLPRMETYRLTGNVGVGNVAEQFRLVLVGVDIDRGPPVLDRVAEVLPFPATRVERLGTPRVETATRGRPCGIRDLAARQVLRTVPSTCFRLRNRGQQRARVRVFRIVEHPV